MDLDAVRTFAAAADAGQFSEAAADLSITQQAVSKRIAALEKDLGVRLFTRTTRGARLTVEGEAFLPHARELLQAEARAAGSVRPGGRALRVDVVGRRLAPAGLLSDFRRAHPGTGLDVVTLFDAGAAMAAVQAGTIDASFRAVTVPAGQLPGGIAAARVHDEPVQLGRTTPHRHGRPGTYPAGRAPCSFGVGAGPALRQPGTEKPGGRRGRVSRGAPSGTAPGQPAVRLAA